MALFSFTKQNGEAPAEIKVPQPEQVPFIPPAPKPEALQRKLKDSASGKGRKDGIRSFFTIIDIYDIFKHTPAPEGRREYEKGCWADTFTLNLNQPELGIFHKVHVVLYANGSYDLIFRSASCEVNKELQEFISFCAGKFGKDFRGKGGLEDGDANDLRLGAFSRVWLDKVRIDNIYLSLNMTLYNIRPEKLS